MLRWLRMPTFLGRAGVHQRVLARLSIVRPPRTTALLPSAAQDDQLYGVALGADTPMVRHRLLSRLYPECLASAHGAPFRTSGEG